MVRYTAIGSFMPDSISNVAATRSFKRTPDERSSANTAAAPVEPTMEPSSMASRQSSPISHQAPNAVSAALITTPTLASSSAGLRPVRKVAKSVRRPPSSRITASATLPTQKLSLTSSKTIPPGPSSPARMPASRNTSRNENPARAENSPASTLKNTSSAAASSGNTSISMAAGMDEN